MPALDRLPPFSDEGDLRMVVETPRGSPIKLKFDPKTDVFTVARSLALGLAYPFDWGFVPGTLGEDGDPLDALAIHDTATFPGVVLPCRVLGLIEMDQKCETGRERNSRLILMPTWHDRLGEFEKAKQLPSQLRKEIERFFLSADFFTDKDPRLLGWKGPDAALKWVKSGIQGPGG